MTRLIKQGKIAKVPTIAGAVNDEGSFGGIRQIDQLTPALGSSLWNLTNDQLEEVISYYAVNETFGYASPDNFFLTNFKAYIQGLNTFGEPGITGSERLVGRYMSDKIGGNKVWTYRFNSPSMCTHLDRTGIPFLTSHVYCSCWHYTRTGYPTCIRSSQFRQFVPPGELSPSHPIVTRDYRSTDANSRDGLAARMPPQS